MYTIECLRLHDKSRGRQKTEDLTRDWQKWTIFDTPGHDGKMDKGKHDMWSPG